MGRSGPAPKPTVLRIADGQHPSRINTAEPRPRDGVPQPPPWFTAAHRDVWTRTVEELTAMGLARAADQDMLAAYCAAVVRWAEATRLVEAHGIVYRPAPGHPWRKNPAVPVAEAASLEITRLGREFGLSPAARVGIVVTASAASGADPARLLG